MWPAQSGANSSGRVGCDGLRGPDGVCDRSGEGLVLREPERIGDRQSEGLAMAEERLVQPPENRRPASEFAEGDVRMQCE